MHPRPSTFATSLAGPSKFPWRLCQRITLSLLFSNFHPLSLSGVKKNEMNGLIGNIGAQPPSMNRPIPDWKGVVVHETAAQ
jgi:hypothetical protein